MLQIASSFLKANKIPRCGHEAPSIKPRKFAFFVTNLTKKKIPVFLLAPVSLYNDVFTNTRNGTIVDSLQSIKSEVP